MYLPLIPHLKAYVANSHLAQNMQYQAKEHIHEDGIIKDVFDSSHYQELRATRVHVSGKELSHKFFEDL